MPQARGPAGGGMGLLLEGVSLGPGRTEDAKKTPPESGSKSPAPPPPAPSSSWGQQANRPLSPGVLPTPSMFKMSPVVTRSATTTTFRSSLFVQRLSTPGTLTPTSSVLTPSVTNTPTPPTASSIKLPSLAISELPPGKGRLKSELPLTHIDNLLIMSRQSLQPPSLVAGPHSMPRRKSPSRSPQRRPSPVRVPSGEGITAGTPEVDDQDGGDALEVSGCQMPVIAKRSSSVSSEDGSEDGKENTGRKKASTPGGKASPKINTPPFKLAPKVVPLDLNDLDPEESATQSEATKRLLDRWQISMTSTPVKPVTTVTLPGLRDSYHRPPGFSGSPSLPSLAVRNPMSSGLTEARNSSRGPRRDTNVINSICLGPEFDRSSPVKDPGSARENCSFQMRMNYGKNLERNWYQNMVEKERMKASERSFQRLVETHKLDGTIEDFYKSFYSSCSDNDDDDDVLIQFKDDNDVTNKGRSISKVRGRSNSDKTDRKSPFIRYASTDVLFSEQSDDSASDIEIILKDNAVYERRVKHKMRRKEERRNAKYQTLFGVRSEDEERLGRTDENGDLIFLPDTEIRALRLKLRTEEDDDTYNESCTLEELRAQVMQALDRLNGGSKRKGQRRRRKKRGAGDSAASKGYGDHKQGSMYDRFISEYGYLLDGYQVEQLSSSDSEGGEHERLMSSQTLPPIPGVNYAGKKSSLGVPYGQSNRKFSGHLPKLNHTYQASPFSQSGLLIGDTYYASGFTFDPSYRPSEQLKTDGSGQTVPVTPRRKKKLRLQRVLNSLFDDQKLLLDLVQTERALAAPLSARRMSDPGVHQGKMLAKQKIIEPEGNTPVQEQPRTRKKRKTKKGHKKSNQVVKPKVDETRHQAADRPQERPQSSQGTALEEDEFAGCKAPRRTGSARAFRGKKDREISLRELTKDYDFPAKEVRLQVAERRLQRQRMRRDRRVRREEREQLDDEFREERRRLVAEAKAEYFKQLEKARAEARKDQGYHTEGSQGEGVTEEEEGEEGDVVHQQEGSRARRFAKRMAKWRRRAERIKPKPDYQELLLSPLVSSCVSTRTQGEQRTRVQLPQEEIVEEAEDVSDLFLEMKNCRWIRWTETQQRIIDHVDQLEMEHFYNDNGQ